MIDRRTRAGTRLSAGSLCPPGRFFWSNALAVAWLALVAAGPVHAFAQDRPLLPDTADQRQPGLEKTGVNVAAKADRLPAPSPAASLPPAEDSEVPAALVDSLVELGVEKRIEQAFAAAREPEAIRPATSWTFTEPVLAYVLNSEPETSEASATASLPEVEIDGTMTGAIPPETETPPEEMVSEPAAEDNRETVSLPDTGPEASRPVEQRSTPKPEAQAEPARETAPPAPREAQASPPPQSVDAARELQSGPTLPPSLLPTGELN